MDGNDESKRKLKKKIKRSQSIKHENKRKWLNFKL